MDEATERVAIVGPAYIVYDGEQRTQPIGKAVIVVTMAGVSLLTDVAKSLFTRRAGESNPLQPTFLSWSAVTVGLRADVLTSVEAKARGVWHHALYLMQTRGCRIPVLSAFGCGDLAAGCVEAPLLYARALRAVLRSHPYGFHCVVLCVPGTMRTVNPDLPSVPLYPVFRAALEDERDGALTVPLLVASNLNAITVADLLSRHTAMPVGVLVPSDPYAVRYGYIGMQWNHPSRTDAAPTLEEELAVRTYAREPAHATACGGNVPTESPPRQPSAVRR
jgi:hypothetical protein